MVDQLISWAALLFSGIAIFVALRVQRRQPELIEKQIAELGRGRKERHKAQVEQRRTRHVADVLTEKHAYGVHEILNGYTGLASSPAGTFDEIVQRDKSWVDDLLQTMRELECSKQEIYSVETLGTFKQLPLVVIKRANVPASMVKARLDRLLKVIDRYAGA